MNNRTLPILAAGLMCLAGTAHAVDLLETYRRALQVDPTWLAAREAVAAGREKAVQGNALLKPRITYSAESNRIDSEVESDVAPPISSLLNASSSGTVREQSVTVGQPLYRAEAWSGATQLREQTGVAEIAYQSAQQDIILSAADTHFAVLLSEESLRLIRAQKVAVKRQLDTAQARFDAGRAKITDVREAQARYDAILASELSAESDLDLRRSQYLELTGTAAERLADVRREFVPALPEPNDLPTWQKRGLEGNLQLQVKQKQLNIAAAEVNKYRLLGSPTLDLVGSYSDSRQSGDLSPLIAPDRSTTRVVGLQLSVPLYTGGQRNSQLRESVAKREQAMQDVAAAKRDARLQVQQAFLAVATGAAQIKALERALESANASLEAATLGRDVGIRTELDVLNIQQQVFSTERDLSQARYNYLLGRLRLAAAVGNLKVEDLMRVNSHLQDK